MHTPETAAPSETEFISQIDWLERGVTMTQADVGFGFAVESCNNLRHTIGKQNGEFMIKQVSVWTQYSSTKTGAADHLTRGGRPVKVKQMSLRPVKPVLSYIIKLVSWGDKLSTPGNISYNLRMHTEKFLLNTIKHFLILMVCRVFLPKALTALHQPFCSHIYAQGGRESNH